MHCHSSEHFPFIPLHHHAYRPNRGRLDNRSKLPRRGQTSLFHQIPLPFHVHLMLSDIVFAPLLFRSIHARQKTSAVKQNVTASHVVGGATLSAGLGQTGGHLLSVQSVAPTCAHQTVLGDVEQIARITYHRLGLVPGQTGGLGGAGSLVGVQLEQSSQMAEEFAAETDEQRMPERVKCAVRVQSSSHLGQTGTAKRRQSGQRDHTNHTHRPHVHLRRPSQHGRLQMRHFLLQLIGQLRRRRRRRRQRRRRRRRGGLEEIAVDVGVKTASHGLFVLPFERQLDQLWRVAVEDAAVLADDEGEFVLQAQVGRQDDRLRRRTVEEHMRRHEGAVDQTLRVQVGQRLEEVVQHEADVAESDARLQQDPVEQVARLAHFAHHNHTTRLSDALGHSAQRDVVQLAQSRHLLAQLLQVGPLQADDLAATHAQREQVGEVHLLEDDRAAGGEIASRHDRAEAGVVELAVDQQLLLVERRSGQREAGRGAGHAGRWARVRARSTRTASRLGQTDAALGEVSSCSSWTGLVRDEGFSSFADWTSPAASTLDWRRMAQAIDLIFVPVFFHSFLPSFLNFLIT
ncbi:unnamed protein product [Protopolystoma xenopodis]|uniref:Uncharacterized protein n=1 Tax=Protopolystoma xenopodis TaxID=117903 RepID=A0A448W9W0_9PLAT|nr:unnamed protein product [Protopolystoma xenopodis]